MYQCKHRDCLYRCSFTETCDFYLLTGRRRESPAAACTRYRRPESRRAPAALDSAANAPLLQALYDAGLNDRQIAAELQLSLYAVCAWRHQKQLPAQKELLYA